MDKEWLYHLFIYHPAGCSFFPGKGMRTCDPPLEYNTFLADAAGPGTKGGNPLKLRPNVLSWLDPPNRQFFLNLTMPRTQSLSHFLGEAEHTLRAGFDLGSGIGYFMRDSEVLGTSYPLSYVDWTSNGLENAVALERGLSDVMFAMVKETSGLYSRFMLPSASIDFFHCWSCVGFLTDDMLPAWVYEIDRVLRPGGIFESNEDRKGQCIRALADLGYKLVMKRFATNQIGEKKEVGIYQKPATAAAFREAKAVVCPTRLTHHSPATATCRNPMSPTYTPVRPWPERAWAPPRANVCGSDRSPAGTCTDKAWATVGTATRAVYESLWAVQLGPALQAALGFSSAEAMRASHANFLDVGCEGGGALAATVHTVAGHARWSGVCISRDEMLVAAAWQRGELGWLWDPRGQTLPFTARGFDVVHVGGPVLEPLIDEQLGAKSEETKEARNAFFAEVAKVVVPGGAVVFHSGRIGGVSGVLDCTAAALGWDRAIETPDYLVYTRPRAK